MRVVELICINKSSNNFILIWDLTISLLCNSFGINHFPYDVHSFDSKYYDFNYERLQKACPDANCLHAHAGSMLRNDEIIVYKEEQCTIRYLVELRWGVMKNSLWFTILSSYPSSISQWYGDNPLFIESIIL